MLRMDAKECGDSKREYRPIGQPTYDECDKYRIAAMQHQICQVHRAGMQAAYLDIEHIRQPRQRLPVDELRLERPEHALRGQAFLHGGVLDRGCRQQRTNTATSCSGYVLLLGVEGNFPQLAHHNICFAGDYRQEFVDIFQRGVPPSDPTIYIAITSKRDPTHAPPGCENWFVLVNAPPLGDHFDWVTQEAAYRQRVLDRLARFGLDVRTRLRHVQALTPVDIARASGAWRGALYGISSNNALNAFRRPHNRSSAVHGLYFVGGTTHPGGGVPMVILSGKVTAELVLADLPFHLQ